MSSYNVPDLASGEIHREEEVIRRSRFIVSIARVQGPEQAKAFIDRIRAEHSDATHNCWAFQAGPAGSTAFAGCSDDGEPKGTAGRPMLTVLLHCGVGEIAAVVTRYFGGVLLGAGGLTRAYAKSAKDALDAAGKARMRLWSAVTVDCPYPMLERLKLLAAAHGSTVEGTDFGAAVSVRILLPQENAAGFDAALTELSAGTMTTRCVYIYGPAQINSSSLPSIVRQLQRQST